MSSHHPAMSANRPAPLRPELLEREASRRRLLEYAESLASRTCLGPPVPSCCAEERRDPKGNAPLFSFGVITDIQYADINDGQSFLGIPRYYRHSLEVTREAVSSWNRTSGMHFAIHFGDLVDGFCPKDQSTVAFQRILSELGQLRSGPVYHMIGNHCLYNLSREKLNEVLGIPQSDEGGSYYHFSPYPGFRIIVLDAYDISELGWPEGHPKSREAKEILERNNPNSDKNSPHGLEGPARRFVKYNGSVGPQQLLWLKEVLQASDANREVVLVCCHLPVDPSGLPTPTCLLWNYEEVQRVLQQSSSVVAFLCGHAHFGGYSMDEQGIHYRVLEAVLECPPGSQAFGRIDVYPDRLCLIGSGRMLSTCLEFRNGMRLALPSSSL